MPVYQVTEEAWADLHTLCQRSARSVADVLTVGGVMSLAKLSAGEGYEYYTRVIATHDANERRTTGIDDYYSEKGESPGVWLGAGLASLGIDEGEQVTEAQMRALLGEGLHPNADAIIDAAITEQVALGAKPKDAIRYALKQAQLGRPYSRYTTAAGSYRHECAKALTEWNTMHGRDPRAAVPAEERRRIRTEVALRMFTDDVGRAPLNSRELSGWIARASRPSKTAVAGFDLTFSPVKSVSTLWAVAPREVSEQIEDAHHAAIRDVISFIESEVLYTRVGRHSVRQVEVAGLIATGFDHRDSRAGDPDLHTHLVISNNVLRGDGKWGAIDGRMIYRYNVTCSEMYNTRLEAHLETSLGLVFADRGEVVDKRPVREVVGVDANLAAEWSKRGRAIRSATAQLAAKFEQDHGREPTALELVDLSQQATLSTRASKHAARSRAEQRAAWRADAVAVLGSDAAVDAMVSTALAQQIPERDRIDDAWIHTVAARTVEVVSGTRATWQHHHIRAEAERQLRGRVAPDDWAGVVARVTDTALAEPISIPRGIHDTTPTVAALARSDGSSVYTTARSTLHTSPQILAAEQRLIEAGLRHGGHRLPVTAITTAIVEYAANNQGRALNDGQAAMVKTFATSGARLQVGLAPAGTGKTTSMQVLTSAWTSNGGTVIGLAPTASAAAVLGSEIATPAATVDLLVSVIERMESGQLTDPPDWVAAIDDRTLVIIDEAAKCGTLKLDAAVSWLLDRGASVRAIGDDRQLSAVAAGGVIRDIVAHAGAADLRMVMRFADPAERAASLAIRDGDPAGLAHYLDHDRIQIGTLDAVTERAYTAWAADIDAGLDSALLAPTRDLVTTLNDRARHDRLERDPLDGPEVVLADGLRASAGDIICTRRNDRRLRISASDYVRNGYRWTVRTVHDDGRITATHLGSGRRITLPADYVTTHTHLGYATTIDTSQGLTVDTCHGVLTGRETRDQLYVMLTRGRTFNGAYLATSDGTEPNLHTLDAVHPPTALDLLTTIVGRDGTQTSATTADAAERDPRHQLAGAVDAYLDALGIAAETHYGPDALTALDQAADQLLSDLTTAPAWPVLRQHLVTLALDGHDPVATLADAIGARELDTAADPAAVLDWRIDPSGHHSGARVSEMGPLGWLPSIPRTLREDPEFGDHLKTRAAQIRELATQVRDLTTTWTNAAPETVPLWAQPLIDHPDLIKPVAVWRASHVIPDHDRRLTGPAVPAAFERRIQRDLDDHVTDRLGDLDTDTRRWTALADRLAVPGLTEDPYWPILAAALTRADAAGRDVDTAARAALDDHPPLPAEQPAAALRWRLAHTLDELPPAHRDSSRDLVAELEADRLRRMSAEDLDAHIAGLQRDARNHTHQAVTVLGPAALREGSRLEEVTAAHARLDAQAAAIRTAQAEIDRATQAMAQHRRRVAEAETDLADLRQKSIPWWDGQGKREREAEMQRLRELRDTHNRYIVEATLAAQYAESQAGIGRSQWSQILADSEDTTTRQQQLDDARDHDSSRAKVEDRLTRIGARIQSELREAITEYRRRAGLTDDERAREDAARNYLSGPERAVEATGVSEHSEPEPRRIEPPIHQRPIYEPPRPGLDLGM